MNIYDFLSSLVAYICKADVGCAKLSGVPTNEKSQNVGFIHTTALIIDILAEKLNSTACIRFATYDALR